MGTLAVVVGLILVLAVLADLINTLVTTTTGSSRFWMTRVIYRSMWTVVLRIGRRIKDDDRRDSFMSIFAPVSVLLLLMAWVFQQVVGFGLIWWGLGGVDGAESLFDAIYYSGVVYFTLGFGEVVPAEVVPRIGALVEAFSGVLTTALVIGYLPALYSAYSERERKLMTLDDGSEDRITPNSLVFSRAPDGDVEALVDFFGQSEDWIAGIIETHSTFPMLMVFRSKHRGQNWVTALGVLTDAALACQIIVGARNREPYWMLRRSVILFSQITAGEDLSEYRAQLDKNYEEDTDDNFLSFHTQLVEHGFDVLPLEQARAETLKLRKLYDAQLEYAIDGLAAPRGFWGHNIGAPIADLDPTHAN